MSNDEWHAAAGDDALHAGDAWAAKLIDATIDKSAANVQMMLLVLDRDAASMHVMTSGRLLMQFIRSRVAFATAADRSSYVAAFDKRVFLKTNVPPEVNVIAANTLLDCL